MVESAPAKRQAPAFHGLTSERKFRPVAKNQKRTLLRKLGVRGGDLDAVAAVYVDVLARALAKIQLLDEYYAVHGIVRADGQGEPTLPIYGSMLNQARLTAWKLAEHMAREGQQGPSLEDYIDSTYPRSNGDETAHP